MTRTHTLPLLIAALLLGLALNALADEGSGTVVCDLKENGDSASGVVSVQRDGAEVASGTCGKDLNVPAGEYTAVLHLDGALDSPTQTQSLTVKKGQKSALKADFATGMLEVRIASQGKRAAGMAIIKREGQQLGTLGSGVAAHLSTGKYEVVARYRSQEKAWADVQIEAGKHVTLEASFE
jgi:hypothetical protein